MARKKRETESASVSFLDVISCGFGAVILLLIITESSTPVPLEETQDSMEGSVVELQQQLFQIRGETTTLNRELNAKHEQLSRYEERIARLRRDLAQLNASQKATDQDSSVQNIMQGQLALARQQLTDEMRRLQEAQAARRPETIGGIPVDSEYIIFIIDTSGSMYNYTWNKMLDVFAETLNVYPQVKGIQVMNDMGEYMFPSFRGQWIPDSPSRRTSIISRLRTWNAFSNSSPVEGINNAIRSFYDPDKKISLYVFGDEFTGNSISEVVRTIDRINQVTDSGERMVRIHAIGFPIVLSQPRRYQTTAIRFATLMREVTRRNGGSFVGLNEWY